MSYEYIQQQRQAKQLAAGKIKWRDDKIKRLEAWIIAEMGDDCRNNHLSCALATKYKDKCPYCQAKQLLPQGSV